MNYMNSHGGMVPRGEGYEPTRKVPLSVFRFNDAKSRSVSIVFSDFPCSCYVGVFGVGDRGIINRPKKTESVFRFRFFGNRKTDYE